MSPTDPTVSPSLPALDRRAFCAAAAAAAASLACGGGGGGAAAPPPPPPTVGPKSTTDTNRNLGNFFLIKDAAGIYAMTTICTHMGCTVGLPVGGQITCPCHGSKYDLSGGNLLGPAVSPLVHLPVTEPSPGADLVVDTSQTVAATVRLT